MPRLSANLGMLFTELPFLDRFAAAKQAGFEAVEFPFPYSFREEDIKKAARAAEVQIVLFNTPPGRWEAGERGMAALPGREDEFRDGFLTSLAVAKSLGVHRIHVMAGVLSPESDRGVAARTFATNLCWSLRHAEQSDITLLIEPINTLIDIPDYYLHGSKQAMHVIEAIGSDHLKLQFDIYHLHIMERINSLQMLKVLPSIGHVQVADFPGRHEPGTGEIDFATFFSALDKAGYQGWVGCEYSPQAGLAWAVPYLKDQPALP